jgi:hypothetical protein
VAASPWGGTRQGARVTAASHGVTATSHGVTTTSHGVTAASHGVHIATSGHASVRIVGLWEGWPAAGGRPTVLADVIRAQAWPARPARNNGWAVTRQDHPRVRGKGRPAQRVALAKIMIKS